MGNHRSYRDESRKDWGTTSELALSLDQVNTGALLRIADATELMARRYQDLINERDLYKIRYFTQQQRAEAAERRISALRGVITRMRRARGKA